MAPSLSAPVPVPQDDTSGDVVNALGFTRPPTNPLPPDQWQGQGQMVGNQGPHGVPPPDAVNALIGEHTPQK